MGQAGPRLPLQGGQQRQTADNGIRIRNNIEKAAALSVSLQHRQIQISPIEAAQKGCGVPPQKSETAFCRSSHLSVQPLFLLACFHVVIGEKMAENDGCGTGTQCFSKNVIRIRQAVQIFAHQWR